MAFADLQFIGWDFEGVNDGRIDEQTVRQKVVLMTASNGESLWSDEGIGFEDRLKFVMRTAALCPPGAVHCFYGGNYDFNKLLEGLPLRTLKRLHRAKGWTGYRDEWYFRYRPRKELTIAHCSTPFDWQNPMRKQCDGYVRFFDVIGFFQSSFLDVVRGWLGPEHPEYERIASWKALRDVFRVDQREDIERYNKAEVDILVTIMSELRDLLDRLGFHIAQWHGAGALAGCGFRKYKFTAAYYDGKERTPIPPEIDEASRYAYFGGRIESGMIGETHSPVWNYDIASAYPYAAHLLPNLNRGKWVRHVRPTREQVVRMNRFTLYRVQWYFHADRPYYPFPFRLANGAVLFPRIGEGWVYAPEVWAALDSLHPQDRVHVWEAWEFQEWAVIDGPEGLHFPRASSPFVVLRELYEQRLLLLQAGDPAEKVLKLFINAIYGKICQKLGWNELTREPPRFHCLPFAGWITSFTRAALYRALSLDPSAVVALCTDGILSTRPLPLDLSTDKQFGKWGVEQYDGALQLQAGVYWLKRGEEWKERARGLGRVVGEGDTEEARKADRRMKIAARVRAIRDGWAAGTDKIYFRVSSLVTSKKACISEEWHRRHGHWYTSRDPVTGEEGRGLDLFLSGWGKRRLKAAIRPGELTPTVAADNVEWWGTLGKDDGALGTPYGLPWLGTDDLEDDWSDDEDNAAFPY